MSNRGGRGQQCSFHCQEVLAGKGALGTKGAAWLLTRCLVELLEGAMGLFQLVHSQVHCASPTVCHHIAISCGGEHEHTLVAV